MSPVCNNTFSGKDALLKFYDPDCNPLLPLVEIPTHPFEKDNVHIYAKMLTFLPAANVKSLPALNMLQKAEEEGKINASTNIVEYSSGSTIMSLAILSRVMGLNSAIAYVSNKTTKHKVDLLRFFGLETKLFGGPGQPSPQDPNGGIFRASVDGQTGNNFNASQYLNANNYLAHQRWTGPQIAKQLPKISVFATGMGTTGTMTGTGSYFKNFNPKIVNVGVCTAPGDLVHGPRNLSLLGDIPFPWQKAVDVLENATAFESFGASLDLCRNGLLCGPSSGLAKAGLFKFLERTRLEGELDRLRADDGSIYCVFTCCDLPYQYVDEYFTILGESSFPPIQEEALLHVDCYPYQLEWELSAEIILPRILAHMWNARVGGNKKPDLTAEFQIWKSVVILDIRSEVDFSKRHFPAAIRFDIGNNGESPNPFHDTPTMVKQWRSLNEQLSHENPIFGQEIDGKTAVIFCYDGNTSRVATSILRHRGVEAYSCVGGISACWELLDDINGCGHRD
ncbi:tryptophan synthase beta subunit-like PLP-dependent enzyme [Lentinula aciculospora]|uniref:Tryptophan synthase beta subunit-like PLP-dependent enzyme n=1 Tax=Lentinula aciculospora TaxID=153920 RepID=A0A9W9DGL0_9AGAR|nr:tryptophan synthase beta subunit-like PLP-dependent enzyme [Lentinula aciculospora]